MMAEVVQAVPAGATIGRNIWGFPQITAALKAFQAVIHDGKSATQAMRLAD